MKKTQLLILGLVITLVIFALATVAGKYFTLESSFFPSSFITHTVMLVLSGAVIFGLKKHVPFRMAMPWPTTIWKPALFGFLSCFIVNILLSIITILAGGDIKAHPLMAASTPLQAFLFVFVYASIAEELLLRGFLQNMLSPLQDRGIRFFKVRLSLPVILSAVVFGLIHLVLLNAGAGGFLVFRIVIFTTVLGLVAGYYQEKYNNFTYAVIVHMAGNLMGLVSAFNS